MNDIDKWLPDIVIPVRDGNKKAIAKTQPAKKPVADCDAGLPKDVRSALQFDANE